MSGPTSGRRSASSPPGHPAPHRRRRQGKAATGFQWSRPEPGCSGNASPRDAGAINHRGAAYLGRAQESPGGRRDPKGRKLRLPKAGVPLAPRLPDSCGKPRFTPGARATRRLWPRVASATSTITAAVGPTSTRGCAEATTPGVGDTMTAGRIGVLRPNHPVRRLSAASYDGRRSRPGYEPRLLSQSTRGRRDRNCGSRTIGWPANWVEQTMIISSSAPPPVPLRHRSSLARAPASEADLQLGRPGPSLHRQFPRHVRAPWKLLGSPKLPPAAGRVSPGLHPVIPEAAHRAAQRHRFGCHRRVPRWHHLSRPGEQAGSQDPHQGERADGHRHQVCLWPGGS
jgi:hypothetical protein